MVDNYYSYYEEVKENEELGLTLYFKKPDLYDEIQWFRSLYRSVLSGDSIAIVAELDGRVLGLCEAKRLRSGSEISHIAVVGISISKEYKGIGVGTQLMRRLIELSIGRFKALTLEVFAVNKGSISVYKKLEFFE
ncbi:MAG: GNAT family N-acetyltransferase [Thermoplasmata archaeon]